MESLRFAPTFDIRNDTNAMNCDTQLQHSFIIENLSRDLIANFLAGKFSIKNTI
jgi:hypothetical protein